jgi:hypothetical protein
MWDSISLLRLYVDDKASDPDRLFDDTAMQAFIDAHPDDLHAAASEIWGIKAATVSEWYLSQTDGSLLARQQVFDHCLKMQDYHNKQGANTLVSVLMDGGSAPEEESSEF